MRHSRNNQKILKKIQKLEAKKEKNKKRVKKSKLTLSTFLILVVLFILILPLLITFSRYVIKNIDNFFLRTDKFYFTSDKLGENKPIFKILNWSGVDEYKIVINMSSVNNLRQSTDYDIDYNINYNSSDNINVKTNKNEGRISKITKQDIITVTISPKVQLKDKDKAYVEISATSKTKYEKKISGRFEFEVGKEALTYTITDEQRKNYMMVNITNTIPYYTVRKAFGRYKVGDRVSRTDYDNLSKTDKANLYSAEVKISFDPNKYILDTTSQKYIERIDESKQKIDGHDYLNSISFNINPISSAGIRLYKKNPLEDNTFPNINNSPSVIKFEVIR